MTAVYIRKLSPDPTLSPAELRAFRSNEARKLLADCLYERYGAQTWSLERSAEGKPYLTSPSFDAPQISLSHSGAWVACALSSAPVGVDVQVVRKISKRVLARFCPDACPDACPEDDDRAGTRFWTRYEACLKRYGSRAEMVVDAEEKGQRYDSLDLDDAVVTVCHKEDEVEWITRGRF